MVRIRLLLGLGLGTVGTEGAKMEYWLPVDNNDIFFANTH